MGEGVNVGAEDGRVGIGEGVNVGIRGGRVVEMGGRVEVGEPLKRIAITLAKRPHTHPIARKPIAPAI